MIRLHKLNGNEVTLNALLIESVESAPDTVINLVTGNRFIVRETVEEVVERVVEFQRRVHAERRAVNPLEGFTRK